MMNTVSPGKENLGVPTLRKKGSINSFLTFSRVRGTKSKPEEDWYSSKVVSSCPLNKENENFKSGLSRLPTSGSSSGRSKMLSPTNITLFKRENRLSKVSPRCETVVSGALEQYKPNSTHLKLEIVNTPENLEKKDGSPVPFILDLLLGSRIGAVNLLVRTKKWSFEHFVKRKRKKTFFVLFVSVAGLKLENKQLFSTCLGLSKPL